MVMVSSVRIEKKKKKRRRNWRCARILVVKLNHEAISREGEECFRRSFDLRANVCKLGNVTIQRHQFILQNEDGETGTVMGRIG